MFIELDDGRGRVEIVDEEASVIAMSIISKYIYFLRCASNAGVSNSHMYLAGDSELPIQN